MANPYNVQNPYQGINSQMYQQTNVQNPAELYYQGNYGADPNLYQAYPNAHPQGYSQYYPQIYPRRSSLLGGVLTGAAVGFTGGALVTAGVDYFKNRKPVNGSGEVSESFARRVMDRIIKKDYVAKGKEFFNQKLNVLRKIDASKTPEKFRKLMQKNRAFCSTLCDGISLDTMCKTVTKENIKGKISAIKERVQASLSTEIQNIKDAVHLCWDKENKKFVQPSGVDNKLFDIIKNTKNSINWKKVCKYGGITAGVFGAATLGLAIFSGRSRQ